MHCFFSGGFEDFLFVIGFELLIMMCFCEIFFMFLMLGVDQDSWILGSVYTFHQIGRIGGIIFSNIFLVPPSSPSGTSSTYTGCLELFHSLLMLCCYCYYYYYYYYLLQLSLSK